MELPAPEIALEFEGLEHLREGRAEAGAWCFLLCARLALARGDYFRTARCHSAANHAIEGVTVLEGATLRPNLLLIESELAAEAGYPEDAARLSIRAVEGFKAAGDADGVIAAWMARAERALRAGNLTAAQEILDLLLPQVDERGDRESGFWLRLRLAAALAQAGRREQALPYLSKALKLTRPGSSERLAATAEGMRIWLDSDRAQDALEVGTKVLQAPASGAKQLHAEVLVLCAVALQRLGQPVDAARFIERAKDFDSPGLAEARARLK